MSASGGRRLLPWLHGFLLALAVSAPVYAAQDRPPVRWWKSPPIQQELALSPDQVSRIDAIFQATLPDLRLRKDELDKLEAKVSRLIEADTDEAVVARWVEKAEAARGSLNKLRTLMLLRMRQVLTPDQRIRFKALHEQGTRDRRPDDPRWPRNGPPPSGR